MLLVVFGAGASYDSDPDHPPDYPPDISRSDSLPLIEQHRPPLANRLFDNRPQFLEDMQSFPDCLALIPQLRKRGIPVEKELARFRAEASTYPKRRQQIASIQYYLHFALGRCQNRWQSVHGGITNYVTFVDEIERWRCDRNEEVCFVTFNYDTMLEAAMERVLRLKARDVGGYRWESYELFKLHGSINWGRVIEHNFGPGTPYQAFIDTIVPDDPRVTQRYHLCDLGLRPTPDTGVTLYPALSIPVEKKDEFSCPAAHVTALRARLPDATKMITVGWRATEAEFLKMLLASRLVEVAGIWQPLSLMVITGSPAGAKETQNNLAGILSARGLVNPESAQVIDGFTGLINNLDRLRAFLR